MYLGVQNDVSYVKTKHQYFWSNPVTGSDKRLNRIHGVEMIRINYESPYFITRLRQNRGVAKGRS